MEIKKLLKKSKTVEEMSIKEQILELFIRDRTANFKNQTEIANAINEMVGEGSKRSQGSVSKILRKMLGKKHIVGDDEIYLDKCNGIYRLLAHDTLRDDVLTELKGKIVDEKVTFYKITKLIACFSLTVDCIKLLKKYIIFSIDKDSILDSIIHRDKLYIIINPNIEEEEIDRIGQFYKDTVRIINDI